MTAIAELNAALEGRYTVEREVGAGGARRFLNVTPRAPAHWSGPFGARNSPRSARNDGATPRGGADQATRAADRRAHDRPRAARGRLARRAEPRHTSTTLIEFPSVKRLPLSSPVSSFLRVFEGIE